MTTPSRRTEPDDDSPIRPHDSTAVLIARVQEGDEQARNRLAARYREALLRWAHGRIPSRARGRIDTADVVQSALRRGFEHLDDFEHRREGAFMAYIRQILLNRIRDEARRTERTPHHETFDDSIPSDDTSPLENLIRRERLDAYERGLASLSPTRREALILRLELGFRYRQIAEAMGLPSGNAARFLASRAYLQLARTLKEHA